MSDEVREDQEPEPAAWEPLSLARIEAKSKHVEEDRAFGIHISLTERELADLVDIRTRIAAGTALPSKYYRRSKVGDRLLKTQNIMHLHLGGQGSDALLYLIQYPYHVLFLSVDTHVHLDDIPPGKKINPLGQKAFGKKIKEGLLPAKPDDPPQPDA